MVIDLGHGISMTEAFEPFPVCLDHLLIDERGFLF
jgi:hypothetical protein